VEELEIRHYIVSNTYCLKKTLKSDKNKINIGVLCTLELKQ